MLEQETKTAHLPLTPDGGPVSASAHIKAPINAVQPQKVANGPDSDSQQCKEPLFATHEMSYGF